jgi:hypothetical protein
MNNIPTNEKAIIIIGRVSRLKSISLIPNVGGPLRRAINTRRLSAYITHSIIMNIPTDTAPVRNQKT